MTSRTRGSHRTFAVVLLAALTVAPLGATAQEAEEAGARPGGRSTGSVILHLVGGAIVGGWLGWMGSQVSYSDWNEAVDGEFATQRKSWVVGGMVTGAVLSQLVGPTRSPSEVPALRPYRGDDRNVITRAEIQSSGATNAFNLVQGLRGEWLRERGVNSWAESARGSADGLSNPRIEIEPGEPTILVYLDANRLGGVDALKDLPIDDLQRLEWVPPQAAVMRYGSGHAHGVIQLSTELRPEGFGAAAAAADASGATAEAAIRSAALDVFMERGYRDASLGEVAAEAGLSRERVRLHYTDKADLFDAVIPSDLAGRLDVRLRQWIQTDEQAMEDRLVELLQERYREILLALNRSEGSAYEHLAGRLGRELSRASLERFRGQDVGRPNRATRVAVEKASAGFVQTLGALLEDTTDLDELGAAVRAQARYHVAGVGALLGR